MARQPPKKATHVKKITSNVWHNRLNETDWNFSPCPSEELEICLWWELHREKAQAEAGGILPPSPLKFQPSDTDLRIWKWRIKSDRYPKGERWEKIRQIAQVPKGWIYHPHFP